MNIFYLCDRQACEKCSEECTHTSDITHAKNFYLIDDAYFESEESEVEE